MYVMSPLAGQRIVLVCESTTGGVGRHVLDLAECLVQYDLKVLLVYAARRPGNGFIDRVMRHAEFGYQVTTLEVDRSPGLRDFPGILTLRRAITEFGGADVLHGHSSKGGALARLAHWGVAKHVVYTPNAFYTQSPYLGTVSRKLFGAIEHGMAMMTDRIITVSRDEYEHALSLGIPATKLVVIENGIALREAREIKQLRAETRARLGIRESDVLIGFLGRLAPQKAPHIAVHAFQRLHQRRPAARMLIVGDGPAAGAVGTLLNEHGLRDTVHWIRNGQGSKIMPAFDVLLLTSLYEGFPYTLLEALESGCAIVTTNVGGAADTVMDGENGFIVDTLDADRLADRLRELCDDPLLLQSMRRSSRERSKMFTVERMVARTVDVYRSLSASVTARDGG